MQEKYPEDLKQLRDQYLSNYIEEYGVTEGRLGCIRVAISMLYEFMVIKNITSLDNITAEIIEQYQHFLYQARGSNQHLVHRYIRDLATYFNRLFFEDRIKTNPLAMVKMINPPDLSVNKIRRYYSFAELKAKWSSFLKRYNRCSLKTYESKMRGLDMFIEYLQQEDIKTIYKVTPENIEKYKQYLKDYTAPDGAKFGNSTQVKYLGTVYYFILYLWRQRMIRENPVSNLNLKQYLEELEKTVPKEPHVTKVIYPEYTPELKKMITKYHDYFLSTGYTKTAIKKYIKNINMLWQYMHEKNVTELSAVTKTMLMDFQAYLYTCVSPITGKKYSSSTLQNILVAIRSFFKYMIKYDHLEHDPSSVLDMPKNDGGLPHTCMTEREVEIILKQPDIKTPAGIRDRAILETLYSTGCRAGELANVEVSHVDLSGGYLRIEQPKGGKSFQRIIPIGKTACEYITIYLEKVRPYTVKNTGKDYLFLTRVGGRMNRADVLVVVKRHLFKSGIKKAICAHSFRVTCATHMLKNDADVRYVQEQLGHRNICTTQGYTRLVPKDLKDVHKKCHPREKNNG
jgi:integrase/recombinase XerD